MPVLPVVFVVVLGRVEIKFIAEPVGMAFSDGVKYLFRRDGGEKGYIFAMILVVAALAPLFTHFLSHI